MLTTILLSAGLAPATFSSTSILAPSLDRFIDSSPPQDLKPYTEKLPNSTVAFQMVPIPGGKIKIGDKTIEVKPIYMGATEATWDMFDQYLLSGEPSKPYDTTQFAPDAIARPSRSYILPDLGWGHAGFPVINVTDTTVEMFVRWLRSVTGKKYRLATEAEWEWAARVGEGGDWKANKAALDKTDWFFDNAGSMTHPVGKKTANKLGLFDMLGNVGEWCKDLDGKPVLCGGDFESDPDKLAPTRRRRYAPEWQETDPQFPKSRWWLADAPFVGFRVVCEP